MKSQSLPLQEMLKIPSWYAKLRDWFPSDREPISPQDPNFTHPSRLPPAAPWNWPVKLVSPFSEKSMALTNLSYFAQNSTASRILGHAETLSMWPTFLLPVLTSQVYFLARPGDLQYTQNLFHKEEAKAEMVKYHHFKHRGSVSQSKNAETLCGAYGRQGWRTWIPGPVLPLISCVRPEGSPQVLLGLCCHVWTVRETTSGLQGIS